MITYEDAYNATNPADSDDARKVAAQAIVLGNAANDVYWNHRSELEALKARAEGHSDIVRGTDETDPTGVGSGTGSGPVIDSTATEEPTTALATGGSATPADATVVTAPSPAPDNPYEAIAKLRAQIVASGGTPGA